MNDDQFRPNISVQGHIALDIHRKVTELRAEAERLFSRLGLITQEALILNEAMQITIADQNGGTYPAPLNQRTFPELNSR